MTSGRWEEGGKPRFLAVSRFPGADGFPERRYPRAAHCLARHCVGLSFAQPLKARENTFGSS
jgi:hypothetical protein